MFRIRLLGRTAVEGDAPVAGGALQRHRLALLALLATAPGQSMSRDKLIAFLWPESDTARARHLLRSAVHVLRRELGDTAIVTEGAELRLNGELIGSDVSDFLDRLGGDEREQAVRTYAGPFLDGFHLNDAPEFEHWLDGERDRLARLYRNALEELAEGAAARGSVADAVEWWRRLAALDPFSSRVTLGLMRSLEAAGDRAEAIQLARSHQELLCEELGAEPDPAVAAYAERLRVAPAHLPVVDLARPVATDMRDSDTAIVPATMSSIPAVSGRPASPKRRVPAVAALVAALALAAAAYVFATRAHSADKSSGQPDASSIAVLPFTNVDGDPDEEYFSDGLTEELIAALARVQDLRVAARTSAFAFKGEDRDIRQIAKALNVATVLEGSVRKDGERVRVHAQLINAANGYHIWADTYERSLSDIFDLQTELALAIATAMKPSLTVRERQSLGTSSTENLRAHTAYLKGRYVWNQRSGGSLRKAIEFFEEAIAADSNYARAYAGLASAYGPMGVHGFIPPSVARERMLAATSRALAIDPDLAEARTALATYRNAYQWDFPGAEKEYLRALALDPTESTGHLWYGFMLEYLGRYDEALVQRRTAMELDPVSPATNGGYGASLVLAGQYAKAIEQLTKAIDLDSTYWQTHLNLGIAYEVMGDLEKAIAAYEKARASSGTSPKATAALAAVFQRVGRQPEGIHLLDSLRADATRMEVHAPAIAHAILAVSGANAALDWLELSYRERHPDLPRVLTDPRCAPLRKTARFIDLRKRVGLTP